MKKLIAIVMSMVFVLVAGVSCFNPNKETEAEYKARIKKELDAIPVEATGYKLVSLYDKTLTYDQAYVSVGNCGGRFKFKMKVGEVCYNVISVNNGTCSDGDFGFEISIEDGEKKWRTYNYDERYKDFGWVFEFISFDEKIFVIRVVENVAWRRDVTDFFPPTLFMYDFESNEMKYIGYYNEWFDYSIFDYSKTNIAIEKI